MVKRVIHNPGERRRLHFDPHKGRGANVQGYVQRKSLLAGWTDPSMYKGANFGR